MDETLITEDNIARVRDLLATMEQGDEAGAKEVLDELARVRETQLYIEMGKLTRELHDAIKSFGMDDQIAHLAEQDIPDARARLKYVIEMTDKAAHRTLGAVEESLPLCEGMEDRSNELHQEWRRFIHREMDLKEFKELSKRLDHFLTENTGDAGKLRQYLNDVLMAQDYQDLTSQIIKRVIGLVEQVEGNLVNLIRLSGTNLGIHPGKTEESEIKATGPVVPGVDKGNLVSGQDEVDDLLSSLGF